MEEPLPAGGSCLLGSINLAAFVYKDCFDYQSFYETIHKAIRALNQVLDEGQLKHPLQEQRDSVRDWRQCGLGIMGLADALIKMGYKYGSQDAIDFCDVLGNSLARMALKASAELAKAQGTYPKYNAKVLESTFFETHAFDDGLGLKSLIKKYGLRNSQLLTIAPTGSISTMLGVSGGIEPIFANSYTRTTKSLHGHDEVYKVYTPIVKEYMDAHGLTDEKDLPDYFVTSADIPIDKRIAMQSIWQQHIDASISSTINLPNETTVEEVEDLYMKAWEMGLKGVTVFRAGCARAPILDAQPKEEAKPTVSNTPVLPWGTIIKCSDDAIGKKRKLQTGCGSLHVIAFFDPCDGQLQEVYLSKGSTGGCANFMTGLSRTISMLCRAGVDVYAIKDQLDSCGVCPSYATRTATKHDTSKGSCCPMAVGNALIEMYEEMQSELNIDEYEDLEVVDEPVQPVTVSNNSDTSMYQEKCPECGAPLDHIGGCVQCKCGYTKCE